MLLGRLLDLTKQISSKNVVLLIKSNSFHYWQKSNIDNVRHVDSKWAHQLVAVSFIKVAYIFMVYLKII